MRYQAFSVTDRTDRNNWPAVIFALFQNFLYVGFKIYYNNYEFKYLMIFWESLLGLYPDGLFPFIHNSAKIIV
jgi:hypothetical protein